MSKLTKERREELRRRVGTELYADGCTYYYGLKPAEVLEVLDALDEARSALGREVKDADKWCVVAKRNFSRAIAAERERDETRGMLHRLVVAVLDEAVLSEGQVAKILKRDRLVVRDLRYGGEQ